MLRVLRRLFDKLKETNADECPWVAGAVHVMILVWEPRAPRRQKIRCRARLAQSGFNCELSRVLAVCRSGEASPSQARKKMTDKTKRTNI
jgi:hypothetical protein